MAIREQNLPLMMIDVTCWQPSKKKNLLTTKVLTSMTELAAMTASRLIILRTRIMFSTTYPAPARDFPKQPIVIKSDYGAECKWIDFGRR